MIGAATWPSPTTWSEHWRDALHTRLGISLASLASGEAYARHDRQLDVVVERGAAHAVAGADRRLPHQVELTLSIIADSDWERLLERWAAQLETSADLLTGTPSPAVLSDADHAGISLLPARGELEWTCSCAHELVGRRQPLARSAAARKAASRIEAAKVEAARVEAARIETERSAGAGTDGARGAAPGGSGHDGTAERQPCKHTAAALLIIGDQLDDDPYELFALRGRTRSDIRDVLSEHRGEELERVDLPSVRADEAWARTVGPRPTPMPLPSAPGSIGAFATDPPPSAPFTADGLRILADDAARRAWRLLVGEAQGHLDLDTPSDLARWASELEGTPAWRGLVERSGLTAQELSARVVAWRTAGSPGIAVQLAHQRLARISDTAQLRQAPDGSWFRFEKRGGRWLLASGPACDPETHLSAEPIDDRR